MYALLFLIAGIDPRLLDAARAVFGDEIRLTEAAFDQKLLRGVSSVVIAPMSSQRCGKVPAVLTFKKGASETRLQALLTLERERSLLKVSRDVQPGETLAQSDLQLERTTRCDARDEQTLGRLEDALGLIAKVRLARGAPLRASELDRPPAISAKDRVRLVVRVGSLLASAPGEALQAGAIGQQIRVTNLVSSRTCFARVLDSQTVEVIP